jgi:hypothetical protein
VPDLSGLQAFSRAQSVRISATLQGLVNHAGQGVVNHAERSRAGDDGLTSLFKPIRNALWHASPNDREHNSGGETKP